MRQLSDIVMSRASSIEQKVYVKSSLVGISHGLEDMVTEFKLESEIFVAFQKFEFFMIEYERYKTLDNFCKKLYIFARNINFDSVKDFKNTVFIELDADDSMTDEWDIIINHPEHPAIFLSKEIFYSEPPKEDQFRKFNGFLSFSTDILLESLKVMKSKLTYYGVYYDIPNINLKKSEQEVETKKISFFLNRTLSEIEDKNTQLITKNSLLESSVN
ncbi:DICT sensory domain-containing protein [Clostridium sp.]|jgi:DICT domain-containing protein|uniref:DICT sensory domain-containing protein n=1 Tax=Clostridium sp. TaxID=1506 RepID=UPI003EE9C4B8